MYSAAAGRGAQSINFMYFKPILRKAYHRKSTSPDIPVKVKGVMDESWWIPDDRTGIFYPKGQKKVIEDIPAAAGKDFQAINWFSNHEDCL